MQDMDNDKDMSVGSMNPDVHPSILRFSIWDKADSIDIQVAGQIVIGRSDDDDDDVDVDLTSVHGRLLGVSRRHAIISLTSTGLAIRDLGSANGTRRNGEALEANAPCELNHGDKIHIGDLAITVYFKK